MTRTLRHKQAYIGLAVPAALLELVTGVFLLVATTRPTSACIVAILSCVAHCCAGAADLYLFWRPSRAACLERSWLISAGAVSLILAGSVLATTLLAQESRAFGARFCAGDTGCGWAGDRARLTGFCLWLLASVAQTCFTVLFVTGKMRVTTEQRDVLASPMGAGNAKLVVHRTTTTTTSERIPVTRHNTDEPFSYEAILQAKSAVPSVPQQQQAPPGHHNTHSNASQQSHVSFVKTHLSEASHSRSWASTLPTVVNMASPRSVGSSRKHKMSDDRTSSRQSGSPDKSDWTGWGMALGSPQHKRKQDNHSLSNTYSTSSSRRSRPTKSLTSFKFHLPNSPEARPVPQRLFGETLANARETRLFQHARGRSTQEEPTAALKSPGLRRNCSLQVATTRDGSPHSPNRKRASILDALRPRLPEGRSLSRNSWVSKSAQSSPTKSFTWSHQHESPSEAAFAEWDTSHVERDASYLVSLTDSRDISGTTPRMPVSDEEDLWCNRSVRVASDGSIVARNSHDASERQQHASSHLSALS